MHKYGNFKITHTLTLTLITPNAFEKMTGKGRELKLIATNTFQRLSA